MPSLPAQPDPSADPPIVPSEFVDIVKPQIERLDPDSLLAFLKARWTARQVVQLLQSHHDDARKIAALCISLVGTPLCIPATAELLRSPCPTTNQLAEHALWSIWFRAGGARANHEIARGAQAIGRREFDHAITHFNAAIEIAPEFAEAYNQRALANFFLDRFDDSLRDCHRAVELMPCHFGAYAGMGHSYFHLGDLMRAIDAYDAALKINPHMQCVRETVGQLRCRVASSED